MLDINVNGTGYLCDLVPILLVSTLAFDSTRSAASSSRKREANIDELIVVQVHRCVARGLLPGCRIAVSSISALVLSWVQTFLLTQLHDAPVVRGA